MSLFNIIEKRELKSIEKKHDLSISVVPYVHRDKGVREPRDLHLVICSPKGLTGLPVFAFVQGSGWRKQKLVATVRNLAKFVSLGYVLAVVEYRYTDEGGFFPSQIEDAKMAVEYLYKHADQYGGDGEHIIIAGDSSGGHTALMAGMTANSDLYNSDNAYCRVDAIIDFYAPTDPTDPKGFPQAPGGAGSEISSEGRLFGGRKLSSCMDEAEKSIVMNYVDLDFAPVFIQHGTADDIVVPDHSIRLHEALNKAGKEHYYELIKGAKHGGRQFYTKKNLQKVDEFIRNHRKG